MNMHRVEFSPCQFFVKVFFFRRANAARSGWNRRTHSFSPPPIFPSCVRLFQPGRLGESARKKKPRQETTASGTREPAKCARCATEKSPSRIPSASPPIFPSCGRGFFPWLVRKREPVSVSGRERGTAKTRPVLNHRQMTSGRPGREIPARSQAPSPRPGAGQRRWGPRPPPAGASQRTRRGKPGLGIATRPRSIFHGSTGRFQRLEVFFFQGRKENHRKLPESPGKRSIGNIPLKTREREKKRKYALTADRNSYPHAQNSYMPYPEEKKYSEAEQVPSSGSCFAVHYFDTRIPMRKRKIEKIPQEAKNIIDSGHFLIGTIYGWTFRVRNGRQEYFRTVYSIDNAAASAAARKKKKRRKNG